MSLVDTIEAMTKGDGDELIAKMDLAKEGKTRLTQTELQIIAVANFGDARALLNTFPAEAVPEEIEGAWRELRSIQPLSDQVEAFLNEGL